MSTAASRSEGELALILHTPMPHIDAYGASRPDATGSQNRRCSRSRRTALRLVLAVELPTGADADEGGVDTDEAVAAWLGRDDSQLHCGRNPVIGSDPPYDVIELKPSTEYKVEGPGGRVDQRCGHDRNRAWMATKLLAKLTQ